MPYGKIKADSIVRDNNGTDDEVTIASLVTKASLASPDFTGTPTAPTANAGTNTTQIATTAYVQSEGFTKLSTDQTWTGAQRGTITSVSHTGATISLDFNASNNFHIQLQSGTADVTTIQKVANSTDNAAGQSGSIFIQQPASGSTVACSGWTGDFRFPAQTALAAITPTLGVVDRIDYVVKDANEIHCVSTLNMSQS